MAGDGSGCLQGYGEGKGWMGKLLDVFVEKDVKGVIEWVACRGY